MEEKQKDKKDASSVKEGISWRSSTPSKGTGSGSDAKSTDKPSEPKAGKGSSDGVNGNSAGAVPNQRKLD